MENKKVVLAFLALVNVINFGAGIVTQLTLLLNWDFVSVFPIVEMGTQQILYINFLALYVVIALISLVSLLLISDGSVSFGEFMSSPSLPMLIVPVLLFFVSIYTTIGASSIGERVICLLISAGFAVSVYVCSAAFKCIKNM